MNARIDILVTNNDNGLLIGAQERGAKTYFLVFFPEYSAGYREAATPIFLIPYTQYNSNMLILMMYLEFDKLLR